MKILKISKKYILHFILENSLFLRRNVNILYLVNTLRF